MRIGLATDSWSLAISSARDPLRSATSWDHPNLAARLQALAEPNAVLIAGGTRRQIGELFETRDLGLHELKGFSEPQRAWQVLGEGDIPSRFAALRSGATPLIGREEELEILRRALGKSKSGRGSRGAGIGRARDRQVSVDGRNC